MGFASYRTSVGLTIGFGPVIVPIAPCPFASLYQLSLIAAVAFATTPPSKRKSSRQNPAQNPKNPDNLFRNASNPVTVPPTFVYTAPEQLSFYATLYFAVPATDTSRVRCYRFDALYDKLLTAAD